MHSDATHLTVRNVPSDVSRALDTERRRHGGSLNQTVIAVLRRALGLTPGVPYDNGLARLAGTWSHAEFQSFEKATAPFEMIDDELWPRGGIKRLGGVSASAKRR
jgi:plasmid stability protein